MPPKPKKASEPSKKTQEKKKEKVIEVAGLSRDQHVICNPKSIYTFNPFNY